jgi:hypothetical protein
VHGEDEGNQIDWDWVNHPERTRKLEVPACRDAAGAI